MQVNMLKAAKSNEPCYNLVKHGKNTYVHMLHDTWFINNPSTNALDIVEIIDVDADVDDDESNSFRFDEVLKNIRYGNYTFALYRLASFEESITIGLKSGTIIGFDVKTQSWVVRSK